MWLTGWMEKEKRGKAAGYFSRTRWGAEPGARRTHSGSMKQEPRRTKTASAAMTAAPRALLRDGRDVRTENGSYGKSAKNPAIKLWKDTRYRGRIGRPFG